MIVLHLDYPFRRAKINNESSYEAIEQISQNVSCFILDVSIRASFRHLTKPVTAVLYYGIFNQNTSSPEFCDKCAIQEMKSERIAQNETNLVFKPNCAEDVCLTDLKLHGRFLNFESPFELNSSRTMELQYNISNEGESGYGTLLEIKFARNISIIKAMAFCEIGADNLSCLINNGQALQRGKVITVNITLDATELDGTELDFEARLFSDGNETFNEDNLIQSSISLVRHSSVSIVEYFNPSHINLDTTFSNVSTSLKVQIDNYGPSYMRATNVTMFIPVLFKQMELIHFDTINSNIINERNYLEWTEECSVSNIEINHTSFIHWRKFESPAMVQKKSSYLSCFDEFITCKCLKFTLKELPAMNDPLWINLQMTIFPQAMINVMPEDTQTIFYM